MQVSENNQQLFQQIAEVIQSAKSKTAKAINSAMVEAYWHIGKIIVEDEQQGNQADYGKEILKGLSKQLTENYGGGFRLRNLYYMRSFYQSFPILHTVRAELSWTHYRLLLKVEKDNARSFYLEEKIKD